MKNLIVIASLLAMSGAADAASSQDAQRLKEGVDRARARVEAILERAGSNRDENDPLTESALLQAASSLTQASERADDSLDAFLNGFIADANRYFTGACVKMGLARSQVSRANHYAIQPPIGFYGPFAPDMQDLVIELQDLRSVVGCP
jgi:hypothetical protein